LVPHLAGFAGRRRAGPVHQHRATSAWPATAKP